MNRRDGLANRAQWTLWMVFAAVACVAGGCATGGPEALTIEPGGYDRAFDAAMRAAGDNDMPAVLRNRRSGVIETAEAIAPSLLEPWSADGAALSKRTEQTVTMQRRRARFEFTARRPEPVADADDQLTGPDLLSLTDEPFDLSAYDGAIELRVWVYIEQAHEPGLKRDTWTRRATTYTDIMSDEDPSKPLPRTMWSVSTRDRAFERRLLARISALLEQAPSDG
jgi:hypothetical protein